MNESAVVDAIADALAAGRLELAVELLGHLALTDPAMARRVFDVLELGIEIAELRDGE